MQFDLVLIGFGVITTETLAKLSIKKKSKKKYKIAIIERDIKNFPGGVAYSLDKSKFGFFNNPLRLSTDDFKKWFIDMDNRLKFIRFINKNPRYELTKWYLKNQKNLISNNNKDLSELYLPRLIYSFFLEDKIKSFLHGKIYPNIDLHIFKAEAVSIIKKKDYAIILKNNLIKYKINKKFEKLSLVKEKIIKIKKIKTQKITIGIGVLPPEEIATKSTGKNKNYIWDFYSEGGTQNLIKKIYSLKKSLLSIVFIGNKAGLLETCQKLEQIIKTKKINIKIISISKSSVFLQKANLSKNYKNFNLKYLNLKYLNKISKAEDIKFLLIKAFDYCLKKKLNKYDAWTKILKENILGKFYNKLNHEQKKKYNSFIFPDIRNLTRFTYPDTVISKENIQKSKNLSFLKDKVIFMLSKNKKILITTLKNKKLYADIVINVSGPLKITKSSTKFKLINSLKEISHNYNDRGFFSKNDFSISNNIYAPGTLSNNFNPSRLTIIKAITKNSIKVAKKISKRVNK